MTTRTVQRLLKVSFPPARAALEELTEAGIVARKAVDRRTTGYLATEVFDLLTFAERRLASTREPSPNDIPDRPSTSPRRAALLRRVTRVRTALVLGGGADPASSRPGTGPSS